MYKFTIFYTCRYIHLFIFFIIINCDMSHVLEINYLILSYLILPLYTRTHYLCPAANIIGIQWSRPVCGGGGGLEAGLLELVNLL